MDKEEEVLEVTFPLEGGGVVRVLLGLRDKLHLASDDPEATYLGRPWPAALATLGLTEKQVWGEGGVRSLHTAALFAAPGGQARLSLAQLCGQVDLLASLSWRRRLHWEAVCEAVIQQGGFHHFPCRYLALHGLAVQEDWAPALLTSLDRVALSLAKLGCGPERTSRLAGLLAASADLLGAMAVGRGGLRSGPAHNPAFSPALDSLEAGRLEQGLVELQQARAAWVTSPSRLVRAARHYEGAVQALVRQTVLSARDQVRVDLDTLDGSKRPGLGVEVCAECPARLDLSGGWTDTPPICYEMGGKVVDMAIQVDGRKPIGCRATRVEQLGITLCLAHGEELQVSRSSDMADYANPTAPGALVKCCLLASGLCDPALEEEQFQSRLAKLLGGGLRLELWSDLPQGSGLGTSSILAGAVLAAVWTSVGASYSRLELVHAVLVVEQLLTTGGGWQDQVYCGVWSSVLRV